MNKQLMITMIMAMMITFASAVSAAGVADINITAGNNYTFQLDTTLKLQWRIEGNSSDMEGFNVTQQIYSNYSDITITTHPLYKSDSFTLILFDDKGDVVIEHHYSSGGGSCTYKEDYDWNCGEWSECEDETQTRTCNVRNNCGNTYGRPEVTQSCGVDDEVIDLNDNDDDDDEDDDVDEEFPPLLILIFIAFIAFVGFILWLIYYLINKDKTKIK